MKNKTVILKVIEVDCEKEFIYLDIDSKRKARITYSQPKSLTKKNIENLKKVLDKILEDRNK